MKIRYGSHKIGKQLTNGSELRQRYGLLTKKIQQRLDEISAAPNLKVLMQIPAANCHQLKGERTGQWALDVSKNFRLVFELDHDPVPVKKENEIDTQYITDLCITDISDYH